MLELPSSLKKIELLLFDMDGVITSEHSYWDVAGLTVRELIESSAYLGLNPPNYFPVADLYYHKMAKSSRMQWRKYLPTPLIAHCKTRGLNNNWDIAYLTFGLYLASLLSPILPLFLNFRINGSFDSTQTFTIPGLSPEKQNPFDTREILQDALSPIWDDLVKKAEAGFGPDFLRAQDMHLWGHYFRRIGRTISPIQNIDLFVIDDFHPDLRGLQLLDELNKVVQGKLPGKVSLFGRDTQLWEDCRLIFQSWFLGEELYKKTYNLPLYYAPRNGLIYHEKPLFEQEKLAHALSRLKEAGYQLGIATGRPRMEIRTPLKNWNLLHYFEQNRIVTNDEVETAERELVKLKIHDKIGKPHPFPFLKAIYPKKSTKTLLKLSRSVIPERDRILIIGDTQADIWAAHAIGCPCVAVLSGAAGQEGRTRLIEANPDLVCNDVLELSEALVKLKSG